MPENPAEAVLEGTVLHRERIALPPDVTVEVRLEDVSRADAPATVIAEQTIATEGRQVPIPFALRYAPERIELNRRYGVRAAIRAAGGELLFTTATHHAVLEGGTQQGPVEVLVQRVDRATADTGSITAGPWRLVAIQRPGQAEEAVGAEPAYTIDFGADSRFGGRAYCNRYTGGYERPEPGRLTLSAAAATLMACPGSSIADEFLRALGAVTGYEVRGEELRLLYGADGVLRFARDSAPVAAAPEVGRTFVFDCDDGVRFTVRTGPGEVALWAPQSVGGQYTVLAATPAASGARYAEGDTVYWNRGELATFEIAGERFVDCRSNPSQVPWTDAARRGAVFRALGNEPAWNLEIYGDRLLLVTDLGARRTERPFAAPVADGHKTTYRAAGDGGELAAVVERRACNDSMSGDLFEAAATVTFDGATYLGCGRFL